MPIKRALVESALLLALIFPGAAHAQCSWATAEEIWASAEADIQLVGDVVYGTITCDGHYWQNIYDPNIMVCAIFGEHMAPTGLYYQFPYNPNRPHYGLATPFFYDCTPTCGERSSITSGFSQVISPGLYEFVWKFPTFPVEIFYSKWIFLPSEPWDPPGCETCVDDSSGSCAHPTPRSLVISSKPDLTLPSPLGDLTIERTYRTSLVEDSAAGDGMFGKGWHANFEYRIAPTGGSSTYGVMLFDADGRKILYQRSNYPTIPEVYSSPDGNGGTITKAGDGTYLWQDARGTSHQFGAAGQILSVTDIHGNQELYGYSGSRIISLTDRHGRVVTFDYQGTNYVRRILAPPVTGNPSGEYAAYDYDLNGNLTDVAYPDGNALIYAYEDPAWPNHMTRRSSNGPHGPGFQQLFQYTAEGRLQAVSEGPEGRSYQLAFGSEEVFIDPLHEELGQKTQYSTTATEWTDANWNFQIDGEETQTAQHTYYYESRGSADIVTKIEDAGCSCAAEKVYDSAFHVVERTDSMGVASNMTYNSQGELISLIEGAGTANERITAFDYDYSPSPAFPGQILEKVTRQASAALVGEEKVTTEINDPATGKLLVRREQGYSVDGNPVLAETGYSYTSSGAVQSIDGPRPGTIDQVTYDYYPPGGPAGGMLWKITEANGAVTTIQEYDALGNVLRKTDPNTRDTVFSYNSRGVLQTQTTVDGTTSYEYDAQGNIATITYPKGNSVSYSYAQAGLGRITDAAGRIEYGYLNGNKISEAVYDTASVLKKSTTYEYDDKNRLWRTRQPGGDFEEFLYDENGNLTYKKLYAGENPSTPAKTTVQSYDPLNRLTTVSVEGDPYRVSYAYDALGNLSSVTDPVDEITLYSHDDLGRQGKVVSAETGTTEFTHDESGNITARRDNINRLIAYTYDGLNRLTSITYPDATPPVLYRYDNYSAGSYPDGIGHLTEVTDASGFRRFFYNAAGRLSGVVHSIDERDFTTEYEYDANGNLAFLTYPGGRIVQYEYDDLTDRVVKVTAFDNEIPTVLAQNITHEPFGPIAGFDYGNGTHLSRDFEDLTYRLQSLRVTNPTVLPARAYEYDYAGNVRNITRDGNEPHDFEYDPVDRLTSWTKPGRSQYFTYDASGNRQSLDDDGQFTSYAYDALTSNLLVGSTGAENLTYGYDELGNITGWGAKTLVYDINGRLQAATGDGVSSEYVYNVDGQRAKKTAGQATYFEFDSGGRLIHEYRPFEGDYIDYVYLAGEPLAMLTDRDMNHFTVTPSAADNGSVTPATPQRVGFNQSVVFTVTPDTDYKIEAVTGCPGSLVGDTYTAGPITDDCTVAASFVIKPGHIIVQQVTRPGSAQSFTFTPSYNGGATFTLSNGQSNDSGELLPGNYSVTQALPDVWGLGGASCDSGDSPSAVTLLPGQTVTCTFTNLQVSMIGTFRNGAWYLDADGSGDWSAASDTVYASFGVATDLPITGDWGGDGATEIGTFRSGPSYRPWFLDADGSGSWNIQMDTKFESFGLAGDIPITGDWNGDGATEIGVFRNGAWSLDADGSGAWTAGIDIVYAAFGVGSDIPITGDWNDDGRTEIGVFRNGTWYLDNGDGTFSAGSDAVFVFGMAGDIPVSGDWNGDGVTDVGVFRSGYWYLDTDGSRSWSPGIDRVLPFGMPSDKPVTGKW